jgi:hypothetical protein
MYRFRLFQPSASPFLNRHKEVQPIPFAMLRRKWLCSHLYDPLQNPNIASSIHAWMR